MTEDDILDRVERYASTPDPLTQRYPSDKQCEDYEQELRENLDDGLGLLRIHAQPAAWTCCGVPVRTVGLSVQCQGACGRTSR